MEEKSDLWLSEAGMGVGGENKLGKGGQKVQTPSYKINTSKYQGSYVQHDDYS